MMKLPTPKEIRGRILDLRRDVIRMMRLKFIAVAMSILIAVFLIMLTAINMIMNTVSQTQSLHLLRQIADSDRYNTVERYDDMTPPDGDFPPEDAFMPDGTAPDSKPDASPPVSDDADSAEAAGDGRIASLALRRDDWGWWGPPPEEGDYPWSDRPQEFTQEPADDDDAGDDDIDDNGETPTENRRPWERRENDPQQRTTDAAPPPWEEQVTPTEAVPEPQPAETPPPAETAPVPDPEEPVPAQADPVAPPVPSDTEMSTEAPATESSELPTESETETETQTEAPPPPSDQNPPEPREPRMDRWKVPITIDHFAILVAKDGSFLGIRNTENYTDEEAEEIMNGILAKQKSEGMYGWLQFCTAEKSYGTLLVITDKTSDQGILNNLFRTTVIIGTLMLLVLLVLLIVLSHFITAPVQQAFTRQKQFVSDAGHELKTPIAVLTTNADILQDEIGENKWLVYMQEQIGRMNQLVGDLLRLARMDNATQEYNFQDFDLSMAVAATTLPFESSAFEQHKTLEMDVPPGIHYRGSEQHIRQLCAIFIDNAIKYSNDNGLIKVTLLQRGEHQILEFYNTGCEISQAETEKIFERFYRGDKARNSTKKSGYGLGLAIAKSIMDVHKIRFQVTCEQGKWIRFLLTL
ncbi:MAG: hypothetical protein II916_08610 [Oscillospiraceae bacterium]|nr:hypothetical protein [Oscillospiraceae bacterium]